MVRVGLVGYCEVVRHEVIFGFSHQTVRLVHDTICAAALVYCSAIAGGSSLLRRSSISPKCALSALLELCSALRPAKSSA